ncbi:hypothetical protein JMJ35_007725 [Cladonia borealis]|uniref:High affinity methionine permease n=1 Tax=Cladonia borealis TaxID=184061 RepID=A0AA39QXN0_9LECA|nr:hypothetical protein JMJ35_007725 [Cladonia borealis]
MSFWRKGKSLIIQDTVEDGSNGIDDAGEIQQEKEGVSHRLHPGELSLEEDIAGGLGRHLGVTSTTFLIVGKIIGSGIFATPSSITSSVGSVGAALMLWVLGAALSFSGLCVWMEFGCMFPRSGGEKVYLEASYPRPRLLATIFFSTQAILLGFSASNCVVFAEFILVAANHSVTQWAERGIAIAVIVFVSLMHMLIPKIGVRIMNVISSIKIFILLFIVITGWVVLSGKVHKIKDPHASFRNSFAGSSHSGYEYATALFKVLNSYEGWSNAAYVLNEVKKPVRTLKIAGPLGLGICTVLYLLANVAYFAAATPKEIANSGVTVAGFFFGRVFGESAERALSVFVALSALGNVMAVTFAQARVNQELAKEGVVPFGRFWASNWPFGSPSGGLLLHFIPSFIILVAIPFGDAYDFILDLEGYPSSVVYFIVIIGLLILRWRVPDMPRPFKIWWPVAVFFLIGQAFLLVAPFLRPPGGVGDTSLPYWLYPVVGIAILVAGVGYWFGWQKVLPSIGRFEWKRSKTYLKDGTVVTQFKPVKQQ